MLPRILGTCCAAAFAAASAAATCESTTALACSTASDADNLTPSSLQMPSQAQSDLAKNTQMFTEEELASVRGAARRSLIVTEHDEPAPRERSSLVLPYNPCVGGPAVHAVRLAARTGLRVRAAVPRVEPQPQLQPQPEPSPPVS